MNVENEMFFLVFQPYDKSDQERNIQMAGKRLLAASCGSRSPIRNESPVVGTVSYGGKPLSHGQIALIHQSGQIAASEIQPDGSHELRAIVTARQESDPNTYNDYASSGLTMHVSAGANAQDWHLSD